MPKFEHVAVDISNVDTVALTTGLNEWSEQGWELVSTSDTASPLTLRCLFKRPVQEVSNAGA